MHPAYNLFAVGFTAVMTVLLGILLVRQVRHPSTYRGRWLTYFLGVGFGLLAVILGAQIVLAVVSG